MQKLRVSFLVILFSTLLVLPVLAQGNSQSDVIPARVHRGNAASPLTGPSNASPVAIVAQFLHQQGRDGTTVGSIVSVGQQRARRGMTQATMEQRVNGLWLYDTYLKAAFTERGELVHLIENVWSVPAGPVRAAKIDERKALQAALQHLYPELKITLKAIRHEGGDTVVFARHPFFFAEPTVRRVALALPDGKLGAAFLVETWSDSRNLLHETLVSGEGAVRSVELRTSTDSYNIFPIDPEKGPQQVTAGPGAGNAQSPAGWLAGSQTSINIGGNNARAYLDADANNAPDGGGSPVTSGNFLSVFDGTVTPSASTNREVAVQNLFYLNNVLHDELYRHGFNEAAGNFQEDNFGLGSRRGGSDSVNAEAQDGGGTDNANFATPRDGQNPRMQMFLWTGKPSHEVVVGSSVYAAAGAAFGPALNGTGVSGEIAAAIDGTAPASDACQAITTSLSGRLALIDRGTCDFVVKVKNVQNAGAIGAIVVNNQGDGLLTMGGTDATITIASVFVGQTDGNAIRAALPVPGTIRLKDPPALQRDGDLDSDIVYHEYGHGLTWRMIGRMSGAMSGAIGEGMSDVLSIIINENDRVAEYSASDPIGIRSAPYTNYPRTYGDVAGTGVHFDGEVYAAIGWRLLEIFQANGLSKDLLLDYIVDGMNFTPAAPSFEDMRDGILQSASGSGHECLIWQAFAQYGVGVGAKGSAKGSSVAVTESFAVPAQCSSP
jgi:extracellular elastinolytic metalloproteinase